jgi:hypothetical protein
MKKKTNQVCISAQSTFLLSMNFYCIAQQSDGTFFLLSIIFAENLNEWNVAHNTHKTSNWFCFHLTKRQDNNCNKINKIIDENLIYCMGGEIKQQQKIMCCVSARRLSI